MKFGGCRTFRRGTAERSIAEDTEGVIAPVEFVMAFGIFAVILVLFFSNMGTTFEQYDVPDSDLAAKSMDISTLLATHTGAQISGLKNWEDDPGNIAYLGLARDGAEPGVLSMAKITALNDSVSYEKAKECLGLTVHRDFCIQIVKTYDGTVLLNYTTPRFSTASPIVKFTQIVSIVDSGTHTTARLFVYVF